jgi:cytochrome c556
MEKKILLWGLTCLLVLATGTLLYAHYAEGVLKADMGEPAQVVMVRKGLMEAIKGNMIDINKKLKAAHIQDIAANGGNIAALASVLPVLYKETYKEVYPFKGSKTYYKGAPATEFEAAAEKMRAAGMEVKAVADRNDNAGMSAAMKSLMASCGGCHSAFRGKY